MQDVKALAGEWRIGNFFVANDKLEAAVHGDCPALKRFATSAGFWRIAEHEAAVARLVLVDGRRWSGQMQPALSGTGQWRSGLQHNHVRGSNSLAGGKIASPEIPTYKTNMMDVTQPRNAGIDWHEQALDLTRGIAAYVNCPLVAGLARVIAKHPRADIANAFNHKQVACKMWALDRLFESCGGRFGRIWVLGGWYGVLPAMLFNDARFDIAAVDSIDIDPEVAPVARTLNREAGDRFRALTADMYALDYAAGQPDLMVNTSCEHIADLGAWLALLPRGTNVLLQSNDYFSEPTHINCVASLAAFEAMAALGEVRFSGELPTKNYTRFMLIGTV